MACEFLGQKNVQTYLINAFLLTFSLFYRHWDYL